VLDCPSWNDVSARRYTFPDFSRFDTTACREHGVDVVTINGIDPCGRELAANESICCGHDRV
jgi:hypothetical protein